MLIVEGVDGSGKTTLCKALLDELSLEAAPTYARSRRKMAESGVRRRTFSGLGTMFRGNMFIHDRLYFSELVYGAILRQHIDFTVAERVWIERTFEQFNVPVVLCLPPRKVAWENVQEKPQMEGVLSNFDEIYDTYGGLLVEHHLVIRPYDYTSEHDTIEDLIDWILPRINELEVRFGAPDGRRTSRNSPGTEWGDSIETGA